MYPVPVSDIITIRFEPASCSTYQLLITDIAGRQVMPLMESATTEDNEQSISLDVHELPAGVKQFSCKVMVYNKQRNL